MFSWIEPKDTPSKSCGPKKVRARGVSWMNLRTRASHGPNSDEEGNEITQLPKGEGGRHTFKRVC